MPPSLKDSKIQFMYWKTLKSTDEILTELNKHFRNDLPLVKWYAKQRCWPIAHYKFCFSIVWTQSTAIYSYILLHFDNVAMYILRIAFHVVERFSHLSERRMNIHRIHPSLSYANKENTLFLAEIDFILQHISFEGDTTPPAILQHCDALPWYSMIYHGLQNVKTIQRSKPSYS